MHDFQEQCQVHGQQSKNMLLLFSLTQCVIKQLLDSIFVISEIIKVSVSVISLSLRLRLHIIALTLTLIIPTSSIVYYFNITGSKNYVAVIPVQDL